MDATVAIAEPSAVALARVTRRTTAFQEACGRLSTPTSYTFLRDVRMEIADQVLAALPVSDPRTPAEHAIERAVDISAADAHNLMVAHSGDGDVVAVAAYEITLRTILVHRLASTSRVR